MKGCTKAQLKGVLKLRSCPSKEWEVINDVGYEMSGSGLKAGSSIVVHHTFCRCKKGCECKLHNKPSAFFADFTSQIVGDGGTGAVSALKAAFNKFVAERNKVAPGIYEKAKCSSKQ